MSIEAFAFSVVKQLDDSLHEVTTFQVDPRVCECAELTEDSIMLLAKLFAGDMVALEVKYHSKCLLALYHCAQRRYMHRKEHMLKKMKNQELFLLNLFHVLKKFVQKQILHWSSLLIWPKHV